MPSLRAVAAACMLVVAIGCNRPPADRDAQFSAASKPSPRLPVTRGDYPWFGHAPGYSWIAGQLMRRLRGGVCTYVQFSATRAAPFGGRIALVDASGAVDEFQNGDMIVVSGDIDSLPDGSCGTVVYRVSSIQEH